jgi:phenylalanyl-tRNA synthetase beta chain
MIVSWYWLTDYLRLTMPVGRLTERLALTGLNHESTEEVGGDLAIDLEVTSNRADCLGHLGVAREISVLFRIPLKVPDPRPVEKGEAVSKRTSVIVEGPDLCPRFTARVVTGATVKESPFWMRKRLETLGVRPINNIVDITNYVMFECGQPMHAYDLDKLAGRRLVVRRARPGEKLVAINGKTYDLTPEMLAIADAERPVGLGGVMGGLDTEIGDATRNVLIESAQFDPVSVRRTSRALGLFSPSSYRFERGLDPERTEWASRRCAELVLELAGGKLCHSLIDEGKPTAPRAPVLLCLDQVPRILGITIDRDRVIAILEALGLEHLGDLTFRPPTWRADLEREADLIEEVARIHGYEHIPEDRPVPVSCSSKGDRERVESIVRETLTSASADEAVTFSLVPEELVVPLQPTPPAPPLRVEHSTRKRETILRPSLVPSLLAARAHNEAHGTPDACFFEIAHVYQPRPDRPLPDEPTRLGIVGGWDFLGLKGVVEAVVSRLRVEAPLVAKSVEHALFTPGRAAELWLGQDHLGYIGEVSAARLEDFGVRAQTSAAELSFDVLRQQAVLVPQARPLPSQPPIARDLSLVVPIDLPWAELAEAARQAAGPRLESLTYLDSFRGGNIAEGHHSLHFGLKFRHAERTLTSDEADQAVQAVVQACAARFGATLRA